MRRDLDPTSDQGGLRAPLSSGPNSNPQRVSTPVSSDGIESAFDPEPDLPLTYVACIACGSMTAIHAPTCPECDQPRPQQVAPVKPFDDLRRGLSVACIRCGDEDGPWAPTADGLVCEPCLDREAA